MSGEGSVFRRASDKAWIAQVSIGPRSQRRYHSRSARTRAEAVEKLTELRSQLRGGVAPSRTTLGDYLTRWVRDARNIRPTTRHGYESVVTYHLTPALGHVALRDLSPLHVEGLLASLEGTMAPAMARNVHAVLRRALGQAVRSGLVTRNVASREFVDAPRVPVYEPQALSEGDVARIVAVDHPLTSLVTVAVETGLRLGELLGLAWEDIGADRLHVRAELVRRDGRWERGEPKTPSSRRTVPLTAVALDALARHRATVIAAGFVPTRTGPVFVNRAGKALSGSWVTHRFYDVCRAAGVERQPFKILRATFGSRLHKAGVPETTIAALMGHTRTHTTRRHYIALDEGELFSAVARAKLVTESVTAPVEESSDAS